MSTQTNWRAMQVPARREKNVPITWPAQGDTNVKCMSMGSWHASASNGGACCLRKGGR